MGSPEDVPNGRECWGVNESSGGRLVSTGYNLIKNKIKRSFIMFINVFIYQLILTIVMYEASIQTNSAHQHQIHLRIKKNQMTVNGHLKITLPLLRGRKMTR